MPIALLAAGAVFVAHLFANPHYGFFRDELYFIVCGRHPALGYVDQPPLVPLLAALSQSAGTSLIALRAIPAICAAIATLAACSLAAELGGGAFAIGSTAVFVALSPILMAFGARLSPDSLEVALWTPIALLCARIARGADPRWWLVAGALSGVALEAKYSLVFFAIALIAGLIATPQRRVLASPWFAGGVLLALAIAAPNVWWQWHNHFPMLALLEHDQSRPQLSMIYPLQQIAIAGPVFALAWIAGLVWLWNEAPLRFLAFAYVVLILVMWGLHGKDYYPAPIYPILFASGGVAAERIIRGRMLYEVPFFAALGLSTVMSVPFIEPVLPMPAYLRYQAFLGAKMQVRFNVYRTGKNTPIEYFADMTGWPALARHVERIYASLPPAQRAQAAILTANFGEASAIDVYAPHALPTALSGNNNFWIWGPRGYRGNVVIDVGERKLLRYYRSISAAPPFDNPYGMPYENHVPVWILRDPRATLAAIWPSLQNYSYLTAAALK